MSQYSILLQGYLLQSQLSQAYGGYGHDTRYNLFYYSTFRLFLIYLYAGVMSSVFPGAS